MTKLLDLDWINSAAPQYNADQNMYEETGSDNNGNLRIEYLAHTAGPPFSVDRAYGYDSPNRITSDAATSMSQTFVYDAFGTLASEYGGTSSTSGPHYLTTDHLGSTRLVTDTTATFQHCLDYFPFGEELLHGVGGRPVCYAATNDPAQKFTGKERDSETGLDYFGARYISAAQGRFTSADIPFADQGEENPQSWNLYAYGRNSPMRFVDPTGRCSLTPGGYRDEGDEMFPGPCSGRVIGDSNNNANSVTITAAPLPITVSQYFGFDREYVRAIAQQSELDYAAGNWDKIPILYGEVPVGPSTVKAIRGLSQIKITWKGLLHVIQRHTGSMTGKSHFTDSAAISGLVRAAEATTPVPQAGGNFVRVVDAGKTVGIDVATGQSTSIYTVITNKIGELVTAFPGLPLR